MSEPEQKTLDFGKPVPRDKPRQTPARPTEGHCVRRENLGQFLGGPRGDGACDAFERDLAMQEQDEMTGDGDGGDW